MRSREMRMAAWKDIKRKVHNAGERNWKAAKKHLKRMEREAIRAASA